MRGSARGALGNRRSYRNRRRWRGPATVPGAGCVAPYARVTFQSTLHRMRRIALTIVVLPTPGPPVEDYAAAWRARDVLPGLEPVFEPGPFPIRLRTAADLEPARVDLLAWADPALAQPSLPSGPGTAVLEARRQPDPTPDLVNGGEAEILEIGYKRVRFRDGEQEFGLALDDPQLRHLDHAYCTTVHAAHARPGSAVSFSLTDPPPQRLGRAAELRRDRTHRRPLRAMLALMLENQADSRSRTSAG